MDNKECSPKHRRGESEWTTRSVLLNTEEGRVNGNQGVFHQLQKRGK
jgi:hypothetical protein